jgi:hypothetical protein
MADARTDHIDECILGRRLTHTIAEAAASTTVTVRFGAA